MPTVRTILAALITALILSSGLSAEEYLSKLSKRFKHEVPVQLLEGAMGKVGVRGEAVIECFRGIKLSEIFYFSTEVNFRYRDNGIEITDENGTLAYGLAEVNIKPRYGSSFVTFNGRAYRGYIKCKYQDSPGNVLVVNEVDIEDYLRGVLPAEIGDRTPDEYEAVKAQAVAARTYAIWRLTDAENSVRLSPTVADQVYSGLDSEKEFLSRGIEETRGVIMIYEDRPIAAFYHAVCGGHTAPVEKIWPERKPADYLIGAPDDTFCSWAKTYSWNETYTLERLRDTLTKYFSGKNNGGSRDFANIKDIKFAIDQRSGRVELIEIISDSGIYRETSDRIRWVLTRASSTSTILPSTNFKPEIEISDGKIAGLKISGLGNGHGVGMCQCGAIGRSRAGEKYDSILKHYYGPVKLAKLY
jgi:stage II sporulation protein D